MKKKRKATPKQITKDKARLDSVAHKVTIVGSVFLLLVIISSISGGITGGVAYGRSGFGFGSGEFFNIIDLYQQYSSWFDFAIFLIIFLGLGQTVLGKHFGGEEGGAGGKAVYIGLAVFLSFALLIWEQQSGFSLLENFGPWAFLFFILILAIWIFKTVEGAVNSVFIAIAVSYTVFYVFYRSVVAGGAFFGFDSIVYNYLYALPFDLDGILTLLFWIFLILGVVGVFKLVGNKT
jgi:hypothetical protein|tara:strand:+ start:94233 stop:94937 length:705 start_codon:yes stop_codon:yes gene_type:complete